MILPSSSEKREQCQTQMKCCLINVCYMSAIIILFRLILSQYPEIHRDTKTRMHLIKTDRLKLTPWMK